MKKWTTTLVFGLLAAGIIHGQGIGISETGADPDPSAGLDVDFTNKGLLMPRLTTEQRDAIQNPASMLMIANVSSNCLEIFIPPNWQNVFCGCTSAPLELSYSDNGPVGYCLNSAVVANNAATQGDAASSFAVSPALPAGLFLNPLTGQITGTPLVLSSSQDYTVQASNACGETMRALNISVLTIPPNPLSVSGPQMPTVSSTVTYSVDNVELASSYTWTIPQGWTIVSGQGTTAVEVLPGSTSGNVSVTAGNVCGTSAESSIQVSAWRPIAATGGTITEYTADGTNGVSGVPYRVHRYTTPGDSSFTLADTGTDGLVDILVVGGGGGGGGNGGGGGGGGGFVYQTGHSVSGSVGITVGAGGIGSEDSSIAGSNGGSSSFGAISALGGGGGASRDGGNAANNGAAVASGGGGGATSNATRRAGGTASQGFAGGPGNGNSSSDQGCNSAGGGGGGAGGSGAVGGNNVGGNGGAGQQSAITGTNAFYAAGGGGGTTNFNIGCGNTSMSCNGTPCANIINGTGGSSVGGNGESTDGAASTGSGGGAERNGASGIVIIRYPITNPNNI